MIDTEVIIQEVFSFICYSIGVSTVAKKAVFVYSEDP
jgi:hypothetical protein